MIEQIFTVVIALIFLLVGYFLGNSGKKPELQQTEIKKPKKNVLIRAAVKAGILEYPSQEEIDYVESGEAKVDAERERVFREQFRP